MSQEKADEGRSLMESDLEELITNCDYNSLDAFESKQRMKSGCIEQLIEGCYSNNLFDASLLQVSDFYRSNNAVMERKESSYWDNLNEKVSSKISSLASNTRSESSLSSEESSLFEISSVHPPVTLDPVKENNEQQKRKINLKGIRSKSKILQSDKDRVLKPPARLKAKIAGYQDRIYKLLHKIGQVFENRPPDVELDYDFLKMKKRDAEFSSRFARNYLYELTRHIRDFIALLPAKSKNDAVFDKVLWLHQIAQQGLQAYVKHLPLTMPLKLHDRVRQFLLMLVELIKLCTEYNICVDLAGIQSKIYVLIVNDSQPTIIKPKKSKNKKQKKHTLSKRLAMYKNRSSSCLPYNNITMPLAMHLNALKQQQPSSGTIVKDPDVKTMMDHDIKAGLKSNKQKQDKRGYVTDITNFLNDFDLSDPAIYDNCSSLSKIGESEYEETVTSSSPLVTSPGDIDNEINIHALGSTDSSTIKSVVGFDKKSSKHNGNYSCDSLLGALEYRNKLENLMSKYKYFFPTGEIPWGITSLIVNQLMNQSIIDIAKKQDLHKPIV